MIKYIEYVLIAAISLLVVLKNYRKITYINVGKIVLIVAIVASSVFEVFEVNFISKHYLEIGKILLIIAIVAISIYNLVNNNVDEDENEDKILNSSIILLSVILILYNLYIKFYKKTNCWDDFDTEFEKYRETGSQYNKLKKECLLAAKCENQDEEFMTQLADMLTNKPELEGTNTCLQMKAVAKNQKTIT